MGNTDLLYKNSMNIKKKKKVEGTAVVWVSVPETPSTQRQATHVRNSKSAVGQSKSQCSVMGVTC